MVPGPGEIVNLDDFQFLPPIGQTSNALQWDGMIRCESQSSKTVAQIYIKGINIKRS